MTGLNLERLSWNPSGGKGSAAELADCSLFRHHSSHATYRARRGAGRSGERGEKIIRCLQ